MTVVSGSTTATAQVLCASTPNSTGSGHCLSPVRLAASRRTRGRVGGPHRRGAPSAVSRRSVGPTRRDQSTRAIGPFASCPPGPARRTRTCARSAARASELPGTLACRAPGRSRGRRACAACGARRWRTPVQRNAVAGVHDQHTHQPGRSADRSRGGTGAWSLGQPGGGGGRDRRVRVRPALRDTCRRRDQLPSASARVQAHRGPCCGRCARRSNRRCCFTAESDDGRGALGRAMRPYGPAPEGPTESAVPPRRAPGSPLVVDPLLRRHDGPTPSGPTHLRPAAVEADPDPRRQRRPGGCPCRSDGPPRHPTGRRLYQRGRYRPVPVAVLEEFALPDRAIAPSTRRAATIRPGVVPAMARNSRFRCA